MVQRYHLFGQGTAKGEVSLEGSWNGSFLVIMRRIKRPIRT
jgi:hypothetical protein